jgi:rhodanese-related sulfurtransferase
MTDQAKRITPSELARLQTAGPVIILDMRRDWDRAKTKIPGAIRVPPDAYMAFASSLPAGRPVATYCT